MVLPSDRISLSQSFLYQLLKYKKATVQFVISIVEVNQKLFDKLITNEQ